MRALLLQAPAGIIALLKIEPGLFVVQAPLQPLHVPTLRPFTARPESLHPERVLLPLPTFALPSSSGNRGERTGLGETSRPERAKVAADGVFGGFPPRQTTSPPEIPHQTHPETNRQPLSIHPLSYRAPGLVRGRSLISRGASRCRSRQQRHRRPHCVGRERGP